MADSEMYILVRWIVAWANNPLRDEGELWERLSLALWHAYEDGEQGLGRPHV